MLKSVISANHRQPPPFFNKCGERKVPQKSLGKMQLAANNEWLVINTQPQGWLVETSAALLCLLGHGGEKYRKLPAKGLAMA